MYTRRKKTFGTTKKDIWYAKKDIWYDKKRHLVREQRAFGTKLKKDIWYEAEPGLLQGHPFRPEPLFFEKRHLVRNLFFLNDCTFCLFCRAPPAVE